MTGDVFELGDGYTARPISLAAYQDACARLEGQVFGNTLNYRFDPPVRAAPPLGETFQWGVYCGEELIGWHHAHAQDARRVYMADTGLLPTHQGRGLYTRLLPQLIAHYQAAGFVLVQSRHRPTNNAVLVPKLRAGFVLQGLHLYEDGLGAQLTLSLDRTLTGAQRWLSGESGLSEAVAARFGLHLESPGTLKTLQPVPIFLPPDAGPPLDLGDGYTAHRVHADSYRRVYAQLEDQAYGSVSFDWASTPTVAGPEWPTFNWLIARGDEVAGWSSARHWDGRTVYMRNSALLPAHRGRGVYSRLLPHLLHTFQQAGYRLVRSHHHATNSAVLIPKLRAGFRFQGLHIDEHGVMAVLICALDPVYGEYMNLRAGLTRPDLTGPRAEVARRLNLEEN